MENQQIGDREGFSDREFEKNPRLMNWQKGYSDGYNDKIDGIDPKIKNNIPHPFMSIFDIGLRQAYDQGYIAGYEVGKNSLTI